MPDVPTPKAARLQKPSWRDTRLLVGVLLVLAATVLGSLTVAAADDRVPMYAANGPLLPGQPLTPRSCFVRGSGPVGLEAALWIASASSLVLSVT